MDPPDSKGAGGPMTPPASSDRDGSGDGHQGGLPPRHQQQQQQQQQQQRPPADGHQSHAAEATAAGADTRIPSPLHLPAAASSSSSSSSSSFASASASASSSSSQQRPRASLLRFLSAEPAEAAAEGEDGPSPRRPYSVHIGPGPGGMTKAGSVRFQAPRLPHRSGKNMSQLNRASAEAGPGPGPRASMRPPPLVLPATPQVGGRLIFFP